MREKYGAIGISALIIFITMVLIAGIAVYVMLSTGSQLQSNSSTTGTQTMRDVATGLKISTIQGHNTSGLIDKIVIIVTPRAGSPDVGLNGTVIELSNTNQKFVLTYSSTFWVDGRTGLDNLFNADAFSSVSSEFGIIVLNDADGSCSQTTPVLNSGDSIMVTLNTTAMFNGISENVNIWGNIIPEEGAWSIIEFRTPSSFINPIIILQQD